MINDEFLHLIKQIVSQAVIEQRPWVYGHVSNYDPATHTVRVIVPCMRDDQTGAPLHSGWLPLGTAQSGSVSGLQVAPLGGATASNPTAGELCMVALNERGTGVAAVPCMFYTGRQQPPSQGLSDQPIQPGEMIIRQNSGTIVRLAQDGSVTITAAADGQVTITTVGKGDITIATKGTGGVNVSAGGGSNMGFSVTGQGVVNMQVGQGLTIEGDVAITGHLSHN